MNLLFPIETINRELDYRLLLASALAGEGHTIYIGQHDYLNKIVPHLKEGGLYLGKNIFHKASDQEDFKHYHLIKNNGFDVIYMHEEGAVFEGDEEDWKKRLIRSYDTNIFDENDVLCDWGDFQANFDRQRSKKAKVIATGHPRFELYKPEWKFYYQEKAKEYKKEYGSYIMVMGNYIIGNHGLGYSHVFSEKGGYEVNNDERRLYRVGHYTYHAQQMHAMVELTHHLAFQFPNINFIYRPHPSENQAYYETVFKGVKNIIVNHKGEVGPWISGALGLIHDGCTTAIEATLAEIPVMNYKPLNNNHYQYWLPNQLGGKVTNLDEAKEMIKNIVEGNQKSLEVPKEVLHYFANFNHDVLSDFLKVVRNKIETKKTKNSPIPFFEIKKQLYKSEMIGTFISYLLRWFKPSKYQALLYHKRKFYGFDEQIVAAKVSKFEQKFDKNINYSFINATLLVFHEK